MSEIDRVREQRGIQTLEAIQAQIRPNLVAAIAAGKELCPSGSAVYAAKLLGVSRSTLRRLRIKWGVKGARE